MAIHLMTVVALVTLILYQKSEGGALGLGQSGFFSGRGQANALTRATGVLATVFFVTSILLTVLPAWERRSLGGEDWTKGVDQEKVQLKEIKPEAAPPAQKETQIPKDKESIFEQLKRAQEQRQSGGGAPAMRKAPEEPAQPTQKPEAPASAQPGPTQAEPAQKPEAPKTEAKPEEAKPTEAKPEAAAPKPEAEPKAATPKPEAPAATPPAAGASEPVPAPRAEEPAPAPKSEAKPEDAKPAPEANPAPATPPPPVQWKSPTR
ncbi:hypothetical protein DSM21852_10390 [Methylocystis bryophila]|nr:hypothetical protein DSM21852_10390 [Methylocystis bryophila]